MRSSARKSDPGYKNFVCGSIITVDGVPVARCYTADEELGEAWCYRVNERAVKFVENGQAAVICHRGKVVITPPRKSGS